MTDPFDNRQIPITAPPSHAAVVIPNDGTDLAVPSRALYVGGAGDIRVRMLGGQETATDIVAEW